MGKFILRDNVHTNIEGRDYGPGDEVELDDARGKELHERGLLHTPESARKEQTDRDEQSHAEEQAEKDAAALEANKVRTAEANRAAQTQPAPVSAKPSAKK